MTYLCTVQPGLIIGVAKDKLRKLVGKENNVGEADKNFKSRNFSNNQID